MKKLFFLSSWLKDRKRTWSGTNYGIFNALLPYFDVTDINLSVVKEPLWLRVAKRLHIIDNDLWLHINAQYQKHFKRQIKSWEGYLFQFAEIAYDTDALKTFIYQDLSIDYVCYLHDHLPDVCKKSEYKNIDISAAYKRRGIQNDYYSQCAGIFAMGHWFAKDLVERMGIPAEKVHAVGGGINVDENLIDESHKESNKILFVGRNFLRKGGHVTVEAFKKLKARMPEAELYVAGPQTDPYGNEKIAGYHFMGDLDRQKLAQLYNKCDIFCLPSYFEAYGLVFIEALTFGLPCIGRNCYEMPYFIKENETGFLLDTDDTERYAELMYRLLHDKRIKENVRSRRDSYIEEYSWKAVAQRMTRAMNP